MDEAKRGILSYIKELFERVERLEAKVEKKEPPNMDGSQEVTRDS